MLGRRSGPSEDGGFNDVDESLPSLRTSACTCAVSSPTCTSSARSARPWPPASRATPRVRHPRPPTPKDPNTLTTRTSATADPWRVALRGSNDGSSPRTGSECLARSAGPGQDGWVNTPGLNTAPAAVRPAVGGDVVPIRALAVDNAMFAPNDMAGFDEMLHGYLDGSLDQHRWVVAEGSTGRVAGAAYYAPEPFADRVWNLYFLAVQPRQHTVRVSAPPWSPTSSTRYAAPVNTSPEC